MSGRSLPPTLYALTPGDLTPGETTQGPGGRGGRERLLRAVRAAVGAGLRGVLLREPALDDAATLELARALRELLPRAGGCWLAVHDRVHVARAADADGAHLGFRSLAPADARAAAGDALTLGLSTHAGDPAPPSEVDHVFFGPVRDTPKPHDQRTPTGMEGLARRCAEDPTPVWALGGLTPEDAREALAAGARGVAVLRGVLAADDPAAAARRYLAELGR